MREFAILMVAFSILFSFSNLTVELTRIKWRLDTIANEAMFMRLCTFDHSRTTCKEAIPGEVKP